MTKSGLLGRSRPIMAVGILLKTKRLEPQSSHRIQHRQAPHLPKGCKRDGATFNCLVHQIAESETVASGMLAAPSLFRLILSAKAASPVLLLGVKLPPLGAPASLPAVLLCLG